MILQKQKVKSIKEIKIPKVQFIKSVSAAAVSAPFCSFLPGIGSGHAAVIGSEITEQNSAGFLFLIGIINTVVMGLSYVTAYSINKTRTGTSAAVQEILKNISFSNLLIILSAVIISGIMAFIIGIKISKVFAIYLNKINYQKLSLITLLVLFLVNLIFSNLLGLGVLIIANSLGIFAISSNSRRINLMGCLLIPSIMYYLLQ